MVSELKIIGKLNYGKYFVDCNFKWVAKKTEIKTTQNKTFLEKTSYSLHSSYN